MENDLAAFGEFIRSFLNEYNLWGSPLFVGGESYGTTRAAGLAGYLTDHDIPINGVMLLSAVIDANASAGEQRQLSTLPTEIMTAHLSQEAAARSAEAHRWSRSPNRRANSPRANTWNICSMARAPRRPSATRC